MKSTRQKTMKAKGKPTGAATAAAAAAGAAPEQKTTAAAMQEVVSAWQAGERDQLRQRVQTASFLEQCWLPALLGCDDALRFLQEKHHTLAFIIAVNTWCAQRTLYVPLARTLLFSLLFPLLL